MNTLDAVAARRSIRKFRNTPIRDEMLQTILLATVQAPSGKNRQPWGFVISTSDKRSEMVRMMREGIASAKASRGEDVGSSERTAQVMDGTGPCDHLCF